MEHSEKNLLGENGGKLPTDRKRKKIFPRKMSVGRHKVI
jgi:hypothetical protein